MEYLAARKTTGVGGGVPAGREESKHLEVSIRVQALAHCMVVLLKPETGR